VLNNRKFASQTKAKKFINDILKKLGFCESIKEKSPQYYEILLSYCIGILKVILNWKI
jgi:hypothetical protein